MNPLLQLLTVLIGKVTVILKEPQAVQVFTQLEHNGFIKVLNLWKKSVELMVSTQVENNLLSSLPGERGFVFYHKVQGWHENGHIKICTKKMVLVHR